MCLKTWGCVCVVVAGCCSVCVYCCWRPPLWATWMKPLWTANGKTGEAHTGGNTTAWWVSFVGTVYGVRLPKENARKHTIMSSGEDSLLWLLVCLHWRKHVAQLHAWQRKGLGRRHVFIYKQHTSTRLSLKLGMKVKMLWNKSDSELQSCKFPSDCIKLF